MDNIKLGLFDIFVYILPGSIVLLSLTLIDSPNPNFVTDIFESSKEFSLFQVTILLSVSYLLGFINQFLSYEIFKVLSKLWKTRLDGKEPSIGKLEDKVVLIRHFSPENFKTLNMWLVLRGMCYSIFVANTLLFLTVLVISIRFETISNQKLLLFVIGFSAFAFLRRSITFHEWIHGTINHATANMKEFKP